MDKNKLLELRIIEEIDTWNIQLRYGNRSPDKYPERAKYSLYGLGIETAKRIYTKAKEIQKENEGQNRNYSDNIDYSNFSFKEATKKFKKEYILSQLKKHNNVPHEAAEASGVTNDAFRHYMMASKIRVREMRKSLPKTDNPAKPEEIFNPVEIAEQVIDSYNDTFKGRLNTLVAYNKQMIANKISEVVDEIIQNQDPDSKTGLYLQDDYTGLNYEDAKSQFRKDYLKHMINKHYCKNLKPVAKAIGIPYSSMPITLKRAGIKNFKDALKKKV